MATWSKEQCDEYRDFANDCLKKCQVPGATIAIVNRSGEIIFEMAYGVTSLKPEECKPVLVDTPFMIGSATKPLTGLLTCRKIDQGKFGLQTKVHDLMNAMNLSSPALTNRMTVEQALSASAGLSRFDWNIMLKPNATSEELVDDMKHLTSSVEPLKKWGYNNMAAASIGFAASIQSPNQKDHFLEDYCREMKRELFDPLGMSCTFFGCAHANKLHSAKPHNIDYVDNKGSLKRIADEFWVDPVAPCGAGWSTVHDLVKALVMLMNNGKNASDQLLSEKMIVEYKKGRVKIEPLQLGEITVFGRPTEYCLAIMDTSFPGGLRMFGHGGNTIGFSSYIGFEPNLGLGLAILTNVGGAPLLTDALIEKFLQVSSPSNASGFNPEELGENQVNMNAMFSSMSQSADFSRETLLKAFSTILESGRTKFSNDILGTMSIEKDQEQGVVVDFFGTKLRAGLTPIAEGSLMRFMLCGDHLPPLLGVMLTFDPQNIEVNVNYQGITYAFEISNN